MDESALSHDLPPDLASWLLLLFAGVRCVLSAHCQRWAEIYFRRQNKRGNKAEDAWKKIIKQRTERVLNSLVKEGKLVRIEDHEVCILKPVLSGPAFIDSCVPPSDEKAYDEITQELYKRWLKCAGKGFPPIYCLPDRADKLRRLTKHHSEPTTQQILLSSVRVTVDYRSLRYGEPDIKDWQLLEAPDGPGKPVVRASFIQGNERIGVCVDSPARWLGLREVRAFVDTFFSAEWLEVQRQKHGPLNRLKLWTPEL